VGLKDIALAAAPPIHYNSRHTANMTEERVILFRGRESHPRSFVKAISWRILGSIDTFVLGLFFTRNVAVAGSIAGTEVVTKILLYYFHERAWSAVPWGQERNGDSVLTEQAPHP